MSGLLCISCGASITSDTHCQACGDSPRLDDTYCVLDVLGQGASGIVYRGKRIKDGLPVAIKELFAGGEVPSTPQHPGLPRVLARIQITAGHRSVHYEVLELIEGETPAEELAGRRPDVAQVFQTMAELLDIAGAFHSQTPPLVHRDIKPTNIIRQPDGRLVLVDFGSVAVERDAPANDHFTASGTVGFMPTEQLAGVVHRSNDIYAIGALAVSMLTRRSPVELLSADLQLRIPPTVPLSSQQRSFLRRLLHPELSQRPTDAAATAREARRLADATPTPASPPWRVLGVALAAICFVIGYMTLSSSPASSVEAPPDPSPEDPPPPVAAPPPEPPSPARASQLDPMWRCEPENRQHYLQRLPPGPSACGSDCADFTEELFGVQANELCTVDTEATPGVIAVEVTQPVERVFFGQTMQCRKRVHHPFGCTFSCRLHREEATRHKFEALVQMMRDRYGPESNGNIQGLASHPREQRRWQREGIKVELKHEENLCCEPNDRSCHRQINIYYETSPTRR